MKVYETTIFEGTPQEIDEMMNGPRQDTRTYDAAIIALNNRYDEVQKSLEILLGGKDAQKRNK